MMATPIMPAMMAARRALLPAVGDTVSTRCWTTETGKAPRFSTRARERTSPSVNAPEIWTEPGKFGVCTVGADWITLSSTIANWCEGQTEVPLKHSVASAFQICWPSLRRSTVAIHCCCWLRPALALPRWNTSPVPPGGPTRQIWPVPGYGRTSWPVVSGAVVSTGTVVVGSVGPMIGGAVAGTAVGVLVGVPAGVVVGGAVLSGVAARIGGRPRANIEPAPPPVNPAALESVAPGAVFALGLVPGTV